MPSAQGVGKSQRATYKIEVFQYDTIGDFMNAVREALGRLKRERLLLALTENSVVTGGSSGGGIFLQDGHETLLLGVLSFALDRGIAGVLTSAIDVRPFAAWIDAHSG